jgi:hypothetical protein
MFGDKPWFQSLTAIGLLVVALGATYGGFDGLPYADVIGEWSLKGGAILAGLGLRKAVAAK